MFEAKVSSPLSFSFCEFVDRFPVKLIEDRLCFFHGAADLVHALVQLSDRRHDLGDIDKRQDGNEKQQHHNKADFDPAHSLGSPPLQDQFFQQFMIGHISGVLRHGSVLLA